MRKLTIGKLFPPDQIEFIETTFDIKIPTTIQYYLEEYSGLGVAECYFVNTSQKVFTLNGFISYITMYNYMKEFQKEKLGKKVPFAMDAGGWPLVFSLDGKTKGQVLLYQAGIEWKKRSEAFEKICDSFEEFINGLKTEAEVFP